MTNQTISSVAVLRHRRGFLSKAAHVIPLFAYILLGYVVIKMSVTDIRVVIASLGSYAITWIEVIHIAASACAMAELLRVSQPGIDNTWEALRMAGVAAVYFGLFLLSAAGVRELQIFNSTEFLTLLLISIVQVILAFMINARTLKRTVDFSGDSHGH